MNRQAEKLERAQKLTRQYFTPSLSVFLPGFFVLDGKTGKYPAISITGSDCQLQCKHCHGKLLEPMISAKSPDLLLEKCLKLSEQGNYGVLISGGADTNGCLPWKQFIPAIKSIKKQTDLFVSIHSGIIDKATACELKSAGVDQALIDIIGDDRTLQDIYHVDFGVSRIISSLEALQAAGLPVVPHIVCGLHFGEIRGEKNAVKVISEFDVDQIVILSVMRLPGAGFDSIQLPHAFAVADIIAETRLAMPDKLISLGCARPRGSRELEKLAIDAGVNRMALPSDEAIAHAKKRGLVIRFHETCCSVPQQILEKFE